MPEKELMDRKTAGEYHESFRKQHPYKSVFFKDKEWRYILSGSSSGSAVVFLHGGGMDAGTWAYQINELEKHYKIIAPSFELVADSFRLRAEALNRILEEEEVSSAVLCGHSYGGILAQYFISCFPQKVEKIILTHTFFPTKGLIERVNNKKTKTLRFIPGFIIKMAFKKRMKAYPDSQYNEFRFVYLDNLYSHMNHRSVMSFYYTFVEKLREELPEVSGWKGKALLINSKDDGDTIDKFQELIDTYPGAEVHLFETGGHHAHMLFPQEFTQAAAEFLKG